MTGLKIKNLYVRVEDQQILHGVNLEVSPGEVHAIMGPNGTGKSTLAYTIMGHPRYEIEEGNIFLDGQEISGIPTEERSRAGLYLAFQYPTAIPGVSVANFLRSAINAHRKSRNSEYKGIPIPEFRKQLIEKMDLLEMDHTMAGRYLNDGFSGGEKKRVEILQMAMLAPKIAVLDETDSGLDIDALRIVSQGINTLKHDNLGILLITHYQRILNYLHPDVVHVMMDGRIVMSGGPDLAMKLEKQGYDWARHIEKI